MKYFVAATVMFLLGACNQIEKQEAVVSDTKTFITNDTIAETRIKPAEVPVSEYKEWVSDDVNNANNWEFSARVYETKKTFVYRIVMQYKELRETADMELPNFGMLPKPAIQKGDKKYTCIIGFLDKKGQFKPYKKLSAANDRLKLTTVAHYSVGVYRTQIK
jgi:hypothetical protein